MLMCMCVNLILRASRWYSGSNSTCSLNSFIIKSIWMFSEHHNSLFNVHWTSSQMLVQMFNEHLIQHQWRYTTNCQKGCAQSASSTLSQTVVLRVGSERGFSALSQNVFAYVWEQSLNLSMKSEMQNWEVCQVFRFVQITKIWNTLWQLKSLQSNKWDDL